MFLPANHPTIEKINKIDLKKLLFKGELAPLYEYRSRVIEIINSKISQLQEGLEEDMQALLQWFEFRNNARYWQQVKEKFSPSEMAEWVLENIVSELEKRNASSSFHKAAGVPSESDLEDALNAAESIVFVGSEKQVKWAKDIAVKNHEKIAFAWKQKSDISLPASAKWWIENQRNLLAALLDLV